MILDEVMWEAQRWPNLVSDLKGVILGDLAVKQPGADTLDADTLSFIDHVLVVEDLQDKVVKVCSRGWDDGMMVVGSTID